MASCCRLWILNDTVTSQTSAHTLELPWHTKHLFNTISSNTLWLNSYLSRLLVCVILRISSELDYWVKHVYFHFHLQNSNINLIFVCYAHTHTHYTSVLLLLHNFFLIAFAHLEIQKHNHISVTWLHAAGYGYWMTKASPCDFQAAPRARVSFTQDNHKLTF